MNSKVILFITITVACTFIGEPVEASPFDDAVKGAFDCVQGILSSGDNGLQMVKNCLSNLLQTEGQRGLQKLRDDVEVNVKVSRGRISSGPPKQIILSEIDKLLT